MKIREFLVIFILVASILVMPAFTFAHPGRTDSSGGHTCRTNCLSWGYSYGEYHYHNSGSSILDNSYDSLFPSYDPFTPSYDSFTPSYDYFSPSYDSFTPSYDSYLPSYNYLPTYEVPDPSISLFSPTKARPGDIVTIYGSDFDISRGAVALSKYSFSSSFLDDLSFLDILFWSDGQIQFRIPKSKRAGDYYIFVKPKNTTKEADSLSRLEVLPPPPEIYSVYPNPARTGKDVTITGSNFGDSKYGDLDLYVGYQKISSYNIVTWRDSKIVFEVDNYLNSGRVRIKDGLILSGTEASGDYLEVLPEEDTFTSSIYSSLPLYSPPTPKTFYVPSTALITPESKKVDTSHIPEGALIRAYGDFDIYIVKYVGNKQFKRLILSPSVFNNYGHLHWEDVMDVNQSIVDVFTTSELVRAVGDKRIYKLYPQGDAGQKRWIKAAEAFARNGWDVDGIYEINSFDRDSYTTGGIIE